MLHNAHHPIVWTVAGSDSGGGAGIEADLKTFHVLGVHGAAVITAATAQNTRGVRAINALSATAVSSQLDALRDDLVPLALKSGLLPHPSIVQLLARCLDQMSAAYVLDPVLVATSGDTLASDDVAGSMRQLLLPRCHIVTPNIPEAETLTGIKIHDMASVAMAAQHLLSLGAGAVLIKGGHRDSAMIADYYADKDRTLWLEGPRIPAGESKGFHGTGCTLAAAITAGLALGLSMIEAVIQGQCLVAAAIATHFTPGGGLSVLDPQWPPAVPSLPQLKEKPSFSTGPLTSIHHNDAFPSTGAPLGFYPIVDRASWLPRLLPLGITTVQLRIKDLGPAALRTEIVQAVALAREYGARLFINDHWQLAIEHGAYVVHLGQDDLIHADRSALRKAGLRLGISTHSFEEAARAASWQPSYLALGPIFPTTVKTMPFAPQGVRRLKLWCQMAKCPVVAIGGIRAEQARQILAAGVGGIAVISDITAHPEPEARAREWVARLR